MLRLHDTNKKVFYTSEQQQKLFPKSAAVSKCDLSHIDTALWHTARAAPSFYMAYMLSTQHLGRIFFSFAQVSPQRQARARIDVNDNTGKWQLLLVWSFKHSDRSLPGEGKLKMPDFW